MPCSARGIRVARHLSQEKLETVYHLKGGILQYLHDVSEDESLWEGETFDQRIAVNHQLSPGQTHSVMFVSDHGG